MQDIATVPLPCCREPFSSFSHLLGAVVFAVLAALLVRRGRGDWARMMSLAVMAFSSVQLLVLSGLYHMFWPGPMRELMVRADVSGIFLLIAGCMTPVHVILFRGASRWAPLILVWTVALVGIVLRMIYFESVPGAAGIAFFLLFGWGCAITAVVLWHRFGWAFIQPAVLAGIAYTVGAIALLFHRPVLVPGIVGPHELWHVAVLSGLALHWRFVFQFASGLQPTSKPRSQRPVAPPHYLRQSVVSQ